VTTVVVVGAGLIGMAAACELARRGARVTVLERSIEGATATTASSAAAGILGPQLEHDDDGPTLELGLEGARATRRLLEAMRGVDVDFVAQPAVKVAFDDVAATSLERRVSWQRAKGLRAELVAVDEARARVPCLSSSIVSAAFFPDDHALDPRLYLHALRSLARTRGVHVVQSEIGELVVEHGRCVGVRTRDDVVHRADHTLLAAGAWSARMPGVRELLGLTLDDVHPVKGQIVELTAAAHGTEQLIDQVIYGAVYLVPRRDGRIVCGSTMEPSAGFDTTVTDDAVARIVAGAVRTVPALAGAHVRATWAGLRPGTKDGLPVLGATRVPGLWVSTGHFRNGVLLAAISAEIVASLVSGEAVSLDLMPFRAERLG
jgi:glycine oxidase